MKNPKIHRCAWALVFAALSACSGLREGIEVCSGPARPIHEVQGGGAASSLAGEQVTIRGVVVGDFQERDQLDGFFLQEPQADGDDSTSEGIFVYAPRAAEVNAGDLVQVSGRVEEYHELTELTGVETVEVCRPGEPPAPLPLELAEARDLEPYEGMLVTLTGELTVAGNPLLGSEGQLLLAAGGRPIARTNGDVPEGARGRRLLLDDGSRRENPATPPYLDDAGTRRAGDAVSGVVGVISEQAGSHVLHPTATPRFTAANPRPAAPPEVGGTVKVAGFNLLNYFTTLGERGASSRAELERQRAKHVAAITALDADVVGLMELQNNGDAALRDLVAALNSAAGADTWGLVPDPSGVLGDDEIRLGFIYRPATTRLVGSAMADGDPVFRRPPLAQTFEARGERFTVVVNHFKSKSCRNATGPEKAAGNGQGCWNVLRRRQASRLVEFVARLQAESGDGDVLVIGDLNAYGAEDPIRALTRGGLVDQVAAHVPPAERYSHVFRGLAGCLDHALTTPSLDGRVTGAAIWHVNADEPNFLDYRIRGDDETDRLGLYRPDPYRSSDHDPVLIGLDF